MANGKWYLSWTSKDNRGEEQALWKSPVGTPAQSNPAAEDTSTQQPLSASPQGQGHLNKDLIC
jgi:hypothetical protein